MNKVIKKGRPKTFNKDQASKIAMETYWKEGIENVSLNEMCRKIGESKPSVYREYGGEEGLQLAALELYYKHRVEPVAKILFGAEEILVGIKSAFDFLINDHFKDEKIVAACMYNREGMHPSENLSVMCKNFIENKDKEHMSFLKEGLKRALDKEDLKKGINLDAYSVYIFNQIKLIASLSSKSQLPKSTLREMVDLIMTPLSS
ncbi:MAG: TetR/AcrR family transcriptional regulator [Pelagibacterales bacterium]|jgi:AcrR family transcriptional regulator|nr:TetR/AcrR family transcriptional regulator [Pelagibacterales bacterium]